MDDIDDIDEIDDIGDIDDIDEIDEIGDIDDICSKYEIEDIAEQDFPVWQVPVIEEAEHEGEEEPEDETEPEEPDPDQQLPHCFYQGESMCGKYQKLTMDFHWDIGMGEILSRPELVCQTCFQRWLKIFC